MANRNERRAMDRSSSSRWSRLVFDGDEKNYELWETKFLGHLRLQGLRDTILEEPDEDADEAEEESKNAEAYAELIQFLDDKSLSLVMRDAADDGRAALKILRDYYAGTAQPRIVSLYTELTSLQKLSSESVTEYIIRAETVMTALKNAGEELSDGLLVAMVLKGLPESFKPFTIHVTQRDDTMPFVEFKTKLRSYEDTEKMRTTATEDNVMKARVQPGVRSRAGASDRGAEVDVDIVCFKCGQKGHRAKGCSRKQWCSYCRSNTHRDGNCRKKQRGDVTRQASDRPENKAYAFLTSDREVESATAHQSGRGVKEKGLMVDTGATSHIITDIAKFKKFDRSFQSATHCVELADGTRSNGIAESRGDAEVCLIDSGGRYHNATLRQALYIPSYPQDIFSVKAATASGATVIFREKNSLLQDTDGTKFHIHELNKLYYLQTVNGECDDQCNGCYDVQTWHEILGHCNYNDVQKLQNVVDGMTIRGKVDKSTLRCDVCTQGKFTQSRSREPDARATAALQLVHTDLAGPIDPESRDGYRWAVSFTDDYSSAVFVYFLRNKSDTVQATEKFLADMSPYGKVKRIRSDNGTEFMGKDYQALLNKNGIRHETSAPYSPHQNGTAERTWRTLFDMARCMLIESELPKNLWTYAVQTAAVVRNRCYSNRTKQTPYFMLTGKQPNISRMQKFGAECYVYKQEKKKLDARSEKGVFVGYDKNSPAYMVYYPDSRKVQKHRLVKFVSKTRVEQQTQTDMTPDDDDLEVPIRLNRTRQNSDKGVKQTETQNPVTEPETSSQAQPVQTEERRNPPRERKKPGYLSDYVTDDKEDKLLMNIDYCYRLLCNVPLTFREAVASNESKEWIDAMEDEMQSLRENDTFTLTSLPEGKEAVGGRWVYAIKNDVDGSNKYKARYVAKGYSQKMGVNYEETFSPTANLTSIRVLMQKAAQDNLILHQMDVKTAYLHAPLDYEIFIEQPEGFEVETRKNLVYKLNKSLYGLKQSGRNWNRMFDEHLCENGFKQNAADHCVYVREGANEKVIIIIWVDDVIIAASDENALKVVKEMLKEKFKMKDLGQLKHFLGIDFNQCDGCVTMTQKRYVGKLLERFNMQNCKPRATPCEQKLNYSHGAEKMTDARKYREVVGSLLYLTTCTRPDLSYTVSKLSQYFSEPTEEQWATVKHVLRYLKGSSDKELCYRKSDDMELWIQAYSDADWAADQTDRRSTTGYCVSLSESGPLISWRTKKQPTVALSTCEAEYMALAATVQECMYLVQLLEGIDGCQCAPPKVYEDNQGAIALARNPVSRQRCKHVDIKYHFVRSTVNDGKVSLEYCSSEDMVADVMTKPATKFKLLKFGKFMFGE